MADECGCGSLFVLLLSCGDSSSSEQEGEGHWVMPSEAVSSLEVDGRVILTGNYEIRQNPVALDRRGQGQVRQHVGMRLRKQQGDRDVKWGRGMGRGSSGESQLVITSPRTLITGFCQDP